MILVWIRFWWIIQDILPRVKILIETCNLLVLRWIVIISYRTFQTWKDVFLVANDIFIFIREISYQGKRGERFLRDRHQWPCYGNQEHSHHYIISAGDTIFGQENIFITLSPFNPVTRFCVHPWWLWRKFFQYFPVEDSEFLLHLTHLTRRKIFFFSSVPWSKFIILLILFSSSIVPKNIGLDSEIKHQVCF